MTLRNRMLLCASATALLLAIAPARAQEDANTVTQGGIENVVVSGSRITAAGFNAPTPTTVLSAQDIDAQAEPNIFSTVAELPSLMGSSGTQVANATTSIDDTGLSAFSIHGLGTIRTLTLIDGQRVVPAYVNGTVDISQFPQLLIQRVDVVTGGASADYGSDAVGGVVNFILDNKFEGLKGNLQSGVSTYGDDANVTLEMAGGSSFAGGRGHFVVSGEYAYNAGVGSGTWGVGAAAGKNGRSWYNAPAILEQSIANTAPGQPEYTFATNVQDYQLANGGLITSGPLQGTTFSPNGTPQQFQYGSNGVPTKNSSGAVTNCISPFCVGGDLNSDYGATVSIDAALQRGNLYSRLSYDLFSNTTIWVGFMGTQVHTQNSSVRGAYRPNDLTIQCGNAAGGPNAFLPASINAACVANNITSFAYGSTLTMLQGPVQVLNQRDMNRFTAGADGSFSIFDKQWTWSAYGEHGVNDDTEHVRDVILVPNLNAALDAVAGPNGTIVCRSAVAQAEGCVPLNVFGNVPASPTAVSFLQGGSLHQTAPYQQTYERQEAFSFILNGEPFEDWAGKIAVATGAEYREEAYTVYGDTAGNGGTGLPPLLSSGGSNWFAGNFHDGNGNYHVSEAFLELDVPVINDTTWGKADLNLAGRATGYSTSGYVSTWKAGFSWDTPIDGLRLRGLLSRDVRAPNLSELFAAPQVSNNSILDPFNNTAENVFYDATGNKALKPEKAANTQLGLVYQPSWFSGFNISIDYYRVGIKGQISSLSEQQEVNLCFEGYTAECSAIVTAGGAPYQTGVYTEVVAEAFNLASTVTDGFDYEASYQFSLPDNILPGNFILRALATNVTKFISNSGVPGTIPIETAGTNTGSIPHWKILGVQTYTLNKWSITFTENWISEGVYNRNYVACTPGSCPLPTANNPTINSDHMDGAFYLDMGGSYNFTDNWQGYFKVDNVANLAPVASPSTAIGGTGDNQSLYDAIGRMFRVGVRVNY